MTRLALAAAVLALTASQAMAHAKLVGAVPAAGATVKAGAVELALTFNEAVEPALSVIEADDAQGALVYSSKGTAVCAETQCTATLPAVAKGDLTVRYSVLSVDGHVVKGSYTFHVAE